MRSLTFMLLVFVCSSFLLADTLITTTGRKLEGRVVSEDNQSITFASGAGGLNIQQVIPRSQIASLTKPPKLSGPVYFEIPLKGSVGQEIQADSLAQALAAARRVGATHIVLLIDSPGGEIPETERIIEVMSKNTDLQTIAFIKNAHSAAAVIAATCKTIVIHPLGQCGAAVPFIFRANAQVPVEVNEKLTSTFRATARTAAGIGGHSPTLFMGMIDTSVELYTLQTPTGVTITEEKTASTKLFKEKGKIVTVTAEEAVKCGLAAKVCSNMKELRECLGLSEWTSAGEEGHQIIANAISVARAKKFDTLRQERELLQQRVGVSRESELAFWQRYLQEAEAEINRLNLSLSRLESIYQEQHRMLINSNSETRRQLEDQYNLAKQRLQNNLSAWEKERDATRRRIAELR